MARKRRGSNKTAAIKEYLAANPTQGPSAVAAALTEQGLNVTAQYVSTIKSKLGLGDGGTSRGRGRARAKANSKSTRRARGRASSGTVTYESLLEARRFVREVGGIEKARAALDAYADFQ